MYFPRTYASKTPEKPAYIIAETQEVVTYAQLERRANRLAHLFRRCGLEIGDHLSIFMENNAKYFEIAWAARRAGLYYTTISTHLTAEEIQYILSDCKAKMLLTSHAMARVAEKLLGLPQAVEHWVMVDGVIKGYNAYEELVKGLPETPVEKEREGADMLYSSGTTGWPKGIVPRKLEDDGADDIGMVHELEIKWYDLIGFSADMVFLSPAPLYHSAPLRFCMMAHRYGGTAVVMQKFNPAAMLSLIEKYRVTNVNMVPTMFIRLLKLPETERQRHDLSSLRVALHGAAPMAVQHKEQMIQWWGPILTEYYGGTEGNGITSIDSQEWLGHKGSVGRAYASVAHVLDDNHNELGPGQAGTIYFSDGGQFEYHNDPEKTAGSRSKQGWTTIGDIGYMDEDGYLYLTGRKSDMIISGGVNIYPQEAENLLITHAKVMDVAVFGIPDEEYGEAVRAVVQPKSMAGAGPELEAELMAFCHKHLSKIKSPKSIEFMEELPRTPTGKLLKRRLKEVYWNKTS